MSIAAILAMFWRCPLHGKLFLRGRRCVVCAEEGRE